MPNFLPQFLDAFLERHPWLMLGSVIVCVVFAALMFIGESGNTIVLYEGF